VIRIRGFATVTATASLIAVACVGPVAPARTATPPVSATPADASPAASHGCIAAAFVLETADGLFCLDGVGNSTGRLVDLPTHSAASAPVLAPDGKRVVFALTLVDPTRGFGTDVYEVDLDGTNLHPLLQHEGDSVFYAKPNLDPSGQLLYVTRSAEIVQNGVYVGNETGIERIDLRSGQRDIVVRDASDPALSPDGTELVYVHLKDGAPDGVWVARADGTAARPLVSDHFSFLQSPRFSPSGQLISFCGAGRSAARPPVELIVRHGQGGRLAHLGIPSAVFVVKIDGTGLKALTQTGDDQLPTWSPDSARIAYVTAGAFYIASVATGTTETVASRGQYAYGEVVWLR
jgi:Tol biopolymer transport system component